MSINKPSVLFVCLGNICRSPTAEAVFRHKAKQAGLDITIESSGTHGYHIGKAPDKRAQDVAKQRGYNFKGVKCRKFDKQDFTDFDLILVMDERNYRSVCEKAEGEDTSHVKYLLDFTSHGDKEVPDPYYNGRKGFELVLDLIEEACEQLVKFMDDKAR